MEIGGSRKYGLKRTLTPESSKGAGQVRIEEETSVMYLFINGLSTKCYEMYHLNHSLFAVRSHSVLLG